MGLDSKIAGKLTASVQRLDRWLWFARVLKSRTLAAQLIERGQVRVNRVRVVKPSHTLREGDVLTVVLHGRVLVLKVVAVGRRRGPPMEATLLYQQVDFHDGAGSTETHNVQVTGGRGVALCNRRPTRGPAGRR